MVDRWPRRQFAVEIVFDLVSNNEGVHVFNVIDYLVLDAVDDVMEK